MSPSWLGLGGQICGVRPPVLSDRAKVQVKSLRRETSDRYFGLVGELRLKGERGNEALNDAVPWAELNENFGLLPLLNASVTQKSLMKLASGGAITDEVGTMVELDARAVPVGLIPSVLYSDPKPFCQLP